MLNFLYLSYVGANHQGVRFILCACYYDEIVGRSSDTTTTTTKRINKSDSKMGFILVVTAFDMILIWFPRIRQKQRKRKKKGM